MKTSEFDSIVVSASESNFVKLVLAEEKWYPIRIHESNRSKLKYIFFYLKRPVSSITHFALVKSIEPIEGNNKVIVYLDDIKELKSPVPYGTNKTSAPQSPRYTTHKTIQNAKSLDDVF